MHAHRGFRAAASGTISADDYRRLLSRLLGFHRPFERLVRAASNRCGLGLYLDLDARARSPALILDLSTLGVSSQAIDEVPAWAPTLELGSAGAVLGALYVLEGSSLGGAQIARSLDGRFGQGVEGRRFFTGAGEGRGALWRSFLTCLEGLSDDACARDEAEAASVATFEAFERWLAGWAPAGDPQVSRV
jgi:heme oxygenase